MLAGRNLLLWCLSVAPVGGLSSLDIAPSRGLPFIRHQQQTKRVRKNSAGCCVQRPVFHRTRLYMDYGEETKLWDRLEVDEDEEPCWYLLNCVATMELALLQQCQSVTADMEKTDIEKFVVPLEKKTRSHGSKKIVTETKVKYPGYVFAKLRLCAQTYQAIQQLDLCRSWMGTINRSGNRKLPPRPVALNNQEIEKFGLEALEETDIDELEVAAIKTDESGVIFDDDNEEDDNDGTPKVDLKALKVYEGLKVDDMVKVTNKGNFYNEDGVVRRLKDGKVFVRFYTYGTMFEEWLRPTDVRKLKADEVLRGLSGPTVPVTQQEFDKPRHQKRENDFMQSARGARFGNRGQIRNRREDRNVARFRRDIDSRNNIREERDNWKWYQNEQRNRRNDERSSFQDGSRRVTPGSRHWKDSGGEVFHRDNQFGQKLNQRQSPRDHKQFGQQPSKRQSPRDQRSSQNQKINRQNDAAISGDDWSSFVSSPVDKSNTSQSEPEKDDFFASLMKDLSKDIKSNMPQEQGTGGSTPFNDSEDDFFSSLMSDLEQEAQSATSTSGKEADSNIPETQGPRHRPFGGDSKASNHSEDDFFASIMSDLEQETRSASWSPERRDTPERLEPVASGTLDDDFFASLEADLENVLSSKNSSSGKAKAVKDEIENTANSGGKEATSSSVRGKHEFLSGDAKMDAFNGSLESELDPMVRNNQDQSPSSEEFIKETSATQGETISTSYDPTSTKEQLGRDDMQSSLPSTTSAPIDQSLTEKTVPVLKEMLRARGLKVSGKKAELVERLKHAS